MDLSKIIINELRGQKEKLEPAIASLEEMRAVAAAVPEQKRRGRKSMTAKERREASARMKNYWADRRK
jgi:hypothetical protein